MMVFVLELTGLGGDRNHLLKPPDQPVPTSSLPPSDPPSPYTESSYFSSVTDSVSEFDFDTDLAVDSDSDSDSDPDSDPDLSSWDTINVPATKQKGQLFLPNCRVIWSPSIFPNYIKFRAYFKHWKKGHTHLVPEDSLTNEDPLVYPQQLVTHLKNLYETNYCTNRLLLRHTNKMTGENFKNFWWEDIVQHVKKTHTEVEAKDTNEKFGSHDGISEEMKGHIASEVNNDLISYGKWKSMTKPTAGSSHSPPVQGDPEAHSATESKTIVDLPESSLTPQQIKSQRKKERRREKRANATVNLPSATTDGPTGSSKHESTKKDTEELLSEPVSDSGKVNVPKPITTKEKEDCSEKVVANIPNQNKLISSSTASSAKGKGRASPDKEKEMASTKVLTHKKMADQPITAASSVIAQQKGSSNIALDGGKEKTLIKDLTDKKTTDQSVTFTSPVIAQRTNLSNVTLDIGKGKSSDNDLTTTKMTDQTIPAASHVTAQPSNITLDKGKAKAPIIATAAKIDQSVTVTSPATAQEIKPSNITLDKGKGKASNIASAAKMDQNVNVASPATVQDNKPSHITLDTGKGKAPTIASAAKMDQSISVASPATAQDTEPSNITLDKGKEQASTIASTAKMNQNANAASPVTAQDTKPFNISLDKGKGNTQVIASAAKPNQSIDVASKVAVPRFNYPLGKGKGKESAGSLTNKNTDQHTDAAKKTQTQTQTGPLYRHPSMSHKEKPLIRNLAEKLIAESINKATKNTTHEGSSSEALTIKGKENTQAIDSTYEKPSQQRSNFSSVSTQHPPSNSSSATTQQPPSNSSSATTQHPPSNSSSASTQYPPSNSSPVSTQRQPSNPSSLLTQIQPMPHPNRGPAAAVSAAGGLKWAYFTHTKADEALLANGIWLFEKPRTYFEYQPYHYVRRGLGLDLAPIAVAPYEEDDVHEPHEPSIDVDNTAVWVNAHLEPWRDVRSRPTHPDFLPTPKLAEYQACESLGIALWRHDRAFLNCRLPGCKLKTADHNGSTRICLGCGPKTIIRYCSVDHQIADLGAHWQECGHTALLMRRLIDHSTLPARLGRLCPAIRDRSGCTSYERSRQAMYAAMHHGRYTLFDPVTEEPTALRWPFNDGRAAELEARVERLLNYALFDHEHGQITGLLYRMVRQCLIQKNFWAIGPKHAVKTQFMVEFGCDVEKVRGEPLCECEWVGRHLQGRHVAGCKQLYLAYPAEYQATGIKGYLEMMEGRFWVLRAWQQRHPSVADWRARVAGEGFVGEIDGAVPFFGSGWCGWGAPPDDLVE